jgi:hypothetical protein
MLPPGRVMLVTKPLAIGSGRFMNTIGMVRVDRWSAITPGVPLTTITSGAVATNSAAKIRMRLPSPPPKRLSIRILRPFTHPSLRSSTKNAARVGC